MQITPEIDSAGGIKPVFKKMILLLDLILARLSQKYHSHNPDDIPSFTVTFARKLVRSFLTFYSVSDMGDYVSTKALLRMLADNVAVFKLIYGCPDECEKEFRHYLYILDGVQSRLKALSKPYKRNDRISEEDYETLIQRISMASRSDENAIAFCRKKLLEHPYSQAFKDTAGEIISKKNWKYKRIEGKGNSNKYSWPELYSAIHSSESASEYLSFLSQYVHGLCFSNLQNSDESESADLDLTIGFFLAGTLLNQVEDIFKNVADA